MEKLGIYAALYPLILCGVLGYCAQKFLPESWKNPGRGLALALGFFVGFIAVNEFPLFPPKQVLHWIPYLAIILALLSPLWQGRSLAWRIAAIDLICLGALYSLFRPLLQGSDGTVAYAVIFAIWSAWMAIWLLWDSTFSEHEFVELPLVAVLCTTGLSVVILDHSIKLALIMGGLASGAGALFLLSLGKSGVKRLGSAPIGVFLILFGAAVIYGHYYNEIKGLYSLLCAGSLLPALLLRLPKIASLATMKRAPLILGLSAIPLAIAIALVFTAPEEDSLPY